MVMVNDINDMTGVLSSLGTGRMPLSGWIDTPSGDGQEILIALVSWNGSLVWVGARHSFVDV
jgi:hypothetical protein